MRIPDVIHFISTPYLSTWKTVSNTHYISKECNKSILNLLYFQAAHHKPIFELKLKFRPLKNEAVKVIYNTKESVDFQSDFVDALFIVWLIP